MRDSSSGHVCHSSQLASSSVYVSRSGATSTGDLCSVTRLAGAVNVHVAALKVIQKLKTTQEGELILIAPWCPSQLWFPHLLRLCVNHLDSFSSVETYFHNRWQVVPSACMEALMQHYQAAGFLREVSCRSS